MESPSLTHVDYASFPAPTKISSGVANNIVTSVSSISFTDKILITISQAGRLSHWVHVPLASASADPMNPLSPNFSRAEPENSLLPRSDLTATTVLGGTKQEDEIVGQTLATTIATAILTKKPNEQRLLVLGLGLHHPVTMGRKGFDEVVGLVLDCL